MSPLNLDPALLCIVGLVAIFVISAISANRRSAQKPYYRRGTRHNGRSRSRYDNSSPTAPDRVDTSKSVTGTFRSQVKSWGPAPTLAEALQRIDEFSGIDFEHYIAHLLQRQGYSTEVTPPSSDKGVDVIAKKDGKKYAVQVKRYAGNVPQDAVMQVVAGQSYHACEAAMVVTNSRFNQNAIDYSKRTGCLLIDREALTDWIRLYDVAHELLNPAPIVVDYAVDKYLLSTDPGVDTVSIGKPGINYLMNKLKTHIEQGDTVAVIVPATADAYEIAALNRLLNRAVPQSKIIDLVGPELDWDAEGVSWPQLEQESLVAKIVIRRDLPKSFLKAVPALKVAVVSKAEDFTENELIRLRGALASQKGRKWFYLIVSHETESAISIG